MKCESVKLGARRGVRAYLRPGPRADYTNVREGSLTIAGKPYKLVQFRMGPPELYRVGDDGLEMFVGYALDVLRRNAGGEMR